MFGAELVVGQQGSGTPPSGLVLSQPGYESVKLDWTNNEPAQQTRIYKKIAAGSFTLLNTVASGVATYTDTAVESGQSYTYYVRHFDGTRMTSPSNQDDIALAIAAPSGLTGNVVAGDPVLDWTNGDANAATDIYRDGVLYDSVAAGVDTYTDTGAVGTFTYWLVHTRNFSESATSNSVVVDTGTGGPSGDPSSLVATASGTNSIDLSWSNGDSSATTEIERSPDGVGSWTYLNTVIPGVAVYQDTGLTPNTIYAYRVKHVKNSISSNYSNVADDTTNALPVLSGVSAASHANGNCTTTFATNRVSFTISGTVTGYTLEVNCSIDGAPEVLIESRFEPSSGTVYHILAGERVDNTFGDFRTYAYSVRLYAGSQDATGSPESPTSVDLNIAACP